MTQLKSNNPEDNNQPSLQESFSNPIAHNLGSLIGQIIGSLFLILIIFWALKHPTNVLNWVNFDIADPHILIPLGASTGLVFYLTAMLSTPVSVAFVIGIIMYLLMNKVL